MQSTRYMISSKSELEKQPKHLREKKALASTLNDNKRQNGIIEMDLREEQMCSDKLLVGIQGLNNEVFAFVD